MENRSEEGIFKEGKRMNGNLFRKYIFFEYLLWIFDREVDKIRMSIGGKRKV